jgi:putative transposase
LKGEIKTQVERDIRSLCEWKNCELQELNVQDDHVHLLVSVPPKVSISKLMGVLKGKIAIKLFKSYPKLKQKPYWGNHFWARGYFVSTVGLDEEMIRKYVKHQEKEEKIVEDNQQKFNF